MATVLPLSPSLAMSHPGATPPATSADTLLRLLVDNVNEYAILTLDTHGHVTSWNLGAERIKGYRAEEILGRHFSCFFPEEDVARGKPQRALEVTEREGRYEEEGWRVRKDGSRFWARVVITALRDEHGRLCGFGKVTCDFTTRKQTEEMLRQSEERFRLLVEGVKDYALFLLDTEGRVASWNLGAERIKGYQAEEILGQHISRFYPEEDVARGKPQWELQVALREGRFEEEGWRVRKDGSRFWANVIITTVLDEHGQLRGFAKVTRDFTSRRQAEQERELQRLREAVRSREEFLSVASHELKTPLTPLQLRLTGLLRTVQHHPEAMLPVSRLTRELDGARRQVVKLAALINQLLEVSHIGLDTLRLTCAPTDLSALVRGVLEHMAPQAEHVGCELLLEAAPGVEGHWDAARLEQVVTSLLSNAFKYGPGRPIHIQVSQVGQTALLSVRDEGLGISLEHQPRIFERFVRAGSNRNYGGLGMGLFISKQVVESHDGSIAVQSALGEGALFTVRLPLRAG